MWTPEHRRAADRRGLRYPSDLADADLDGLDDENKPEAPGHRIT